MNLHPLARPELRALSLPPPLIARPRPRLDLGSNTSRFAAADADYPNPVPTELAESYAAWLDADLSSDNIILTPGASGGIELLLRAFGGRLCLTPPTFPMYAHWAAIYGRQTVAVPLLGDDFDRLDVPRILAADADIILLCTPGNPTGSELRADDIDEILARARGIVCIDEAYFEFGRSPSWVSMIHNVPNLAVVRTFSKAWGLASVRCGVVAASPAIIDSLRLAQSPFAVSSEALAKAGAALRDPSVMRSQVERLRVERGWLGERLAEIVGVERVFASETNFLLVRFTDAEGVLKRLAQAGIAVADSRRAVAGCLRITVGTRVENEEVLKSVTG